MPLIESCEFGHIIVDGQSYRKDLIIYPDHVDASWWRRQGHRLAPEDLPEVFASPPEVLVVGQGNPGLMAVPADTLERLRAAGIEVIVRPTAEAVAAYNRLQGGRRVVAALHLTC